MFGIRGFRNQPLKLDLVITPSGADLLVHVPCWFIVVETDGPHHFTPTSYGGQELSDPAAQRESDVAKMLAYCENKGRRCSFIRQRAKPIYESCRQARGYDTRAWYNCALALVGERAREGLVSMVYAKEPDNDWYGDHARDMRAKDSTVLCVPLHTDNFPLMENACRYGALLH